MTNIVQSGQKNNGVTRPVSVVTSGEAVILQDGRTLKNLVEEHTEVKRQVEEVQQELEGLKIDEFSPTIIQTSSMSTLGQGDNIDVSTNVGDGFFKSATLKGNTLVNCIQEPSSKDIILPYEFKEGQRVTINDTRESGALNINLKGQTLVNLFDTDLVKFYHTPSSIENGVITLPVVNHIYNNFSIPKDKCHMFKPSTTYTLIVNMIENNTSPQEGESEQGSSFNLGSYSHSASIVKQGYNVNGNAVSYCCYIRPRETGLFIGKFITHDKEEYDIKTSGIEFGLGTYYSATGGQQKLSIVILEGDYTNTNMNIPYFEGISSVKMPVLKTFNNIVDFSNDELEFEYGCYFGQKANGTDWVNNKGVPDSFVYTLNYIEVLSNKDKMRFYGNDTVIDRVVWFDENKNQIGTSLGHNNQTVTIPTRAKYFRFLLNDSRFVTDKELAKNNIGHYNFYYGDENKSFNNEPFKSNILTTPSDLTLRGIGNVKDTLDCLTGEVTERIGVAKLSLIPDADFGDFSPNGVNAILTNTANINIYKAKFNKYFQPYRSSLNAISNFAPVKGTTYEKDYECFALHNDNRQSVQISLSHSRFNGDLTREKMIQLIKELDITIMYELATPVIKTVNLTITNQDGDTVTTLNPFNTTTHIYSEVPENSLYPTISHITPSYPVMLKPSTKYSIVADSYINDHPTANINFSLGGAIGSTTVGNRVTTITTQSTLSSNKLIMSGRGHKLNNVMVIEGDIKGNEPYFEGLSSCSSPVLTTVDKYTNIPLSFFENNNEGFAGWTIFRCNYSLVKVTAKLNKFLQNDTRFRINMSNVYTLDLSNFEERTVSVENVEWIGFHTDTNSIANGGNSRLLEYLTTGAVELRFEIEGEPLYPLYDNSSKMNTLSTPQEVVLCGIGNTQDTLNVISGELTKRICRLVLDGSSNENWKMYQLSDTYPDVIGFYYVLTTRRQPNRFYRYIGELPITDTDVFPGRLGTNKEMILTNNSQYIKLAVSRNKLETLTIDGLMKYLSKNPIEFCYIMADPETEIVPINGELLAFKEGHISLSSDSDGYSLTPSLEYSVPVSKAAQITQNSMVAIKHAKQLYNLEILMYASTIEDTYRRYVLQNNVQTRSSSSRKTSNPITYHMLSKLIEENYYEQDKLLDKLDIFLLYNEITLDQYNELSDLIFI